MANAIEFENVSKQYRLGLVSTGTLRHDINRWWQTSILGKEDPYLKIGETNDRSTKGLSEYVWALRAIDFSVEQGDVVGIIGKNGAGKSTLLKLLSRVTGPSIGTIRAHGRIGSLLEVGTGFHPEMTGRENIYMNGAILGMSRSEIDRKIDEIIDFSGCERYIDTPVKRYSSGMTVRLGFAVAAFLEPEILVVDEVLAVGDAEFQKKAIGKMKDVSHGDGRTVLFVSHNMASIQRLCRKGLLLDKGRVAYNGSVSEAIDRYLSDNIVQSEYTNQHVNTNDPICLLWAKVIPENNSDVIYVNQKITIEYCVAINGTVNNLVCGFNLISSYHYPIARADYNDFEKRVTLEKGTYIFRFVIPANTLSDGAYRIVFDVAERNVKNYADDDSAITFDVNIPSNSFINAYSEDMDIKKSIIREQWLDGYEKVE